MAAKYLVNVHLEPNHMGTLVWINVMFRDSVAMTSPVFLVAQNGSLNAYLLLNFLDHRYKVKEE